MWRCSVNFCHIVQYSPTLDSNWCWGRPKRLVQISHRKRLSHMCIAPFHSRVKTGWVWAIRSGMRNNVGTGEITWSWNRILTGLEPAGNLWHQLDSQDVGRIACATAAGVSVGPGSWRIVASRRPCIFFSQAIVPGTTWHQWRHCGFWSGHACLFRPLGNWHDLIRRVCADGSTSGLQDSAECQQSPGWRERRKVLEDEAIDSLCATAEASGANPRRIRNGHTVLNNLTGRHCLRGFIPLWTLEPRQGDWEDVQELTEDQLALLHEKILQMESDAQKEALSGDPPKYFVTISGRARHRRYAIRMIMPLAHLVRADFFTNAGKQSNGTFFWWNGNFVSRHFVFQMQFLNVKFFSWLLSVFCDALFWTETPVVTDFSWLRCFRIFLQFRCAIGFSHIYNLACSPLVIRSHWMSPSVFGFCKGGYSRRAAARSARTDMIYACAATTTTTKTRTKK